MKKNIILLLLFIVSISFSSIILYVLNSEGMLHRNIIVLSFEVLLFTLIFWIINNLFNKKAQLSEKLLEIQNLNANNELLLQSTKDGILDWNLEKNEANFSKNWNKLLGYEENEIENDLDEWKKRIHPEDIQRVLQAVQDNQNKITPYYSLTYRIQHKNGTWIWLFDRGKTYFDTHNHPTRMIVFHSDITEVKKLEAKLKESEKNLIFAQRISRIGYWKYNLSNEKFEVCTTLCELMGLKNCNSIKDYNDFIGHINPLDLDKVILKHKEAFLNKNKVQLTYKLNTDKTIIVEETINIVSNDNSQYEKDIIFIGTIQDITDKTILEQELSNLKLIIDLAPLSIMITNVQGEITYVNPHFSKITGYEKEKVMGQNPRILKSGFLNDQKYKDLWETITKKKTWIGKFKNLNKEGEEYWETAIISPILDKNNDIISFLAIKREISHEVFLEEELHEKEELMLYQSRNAAMGEMISMIAHQWRQPITTISMYANNLLVDYELDELNPQTTKEIALNIAEQTQHLSKTIEDFRNFFREDKEIEEIKIKEILTSSSTIMLSSLTNNNISYTVTCDENLKISTYPRELLQVIINILKNAKEALEEHIIENKFIKVEVCESVQTITILISDNGGGIDENHITNIFLPYFTTKGKNVGTGLGLYMSKTIIEKHLQGKLEVHNTQDGVLFTIELPKNIKKTMKD